MLRSIVKNFSKAPCYEEREIAFNKLEKQLDTLCKNFKNKKEFIISLKNVIEFLEENKFLLSPIQNSYDSLNLFSIISNLLIIENFNKFNDLSSLDLKINNQSLFKNLEKYYYKNYRFSFNWEEIFGFPKTISISNDSEDDEIIEYKFNLPINIKNNFDFVIIQFIYKIIASFIPNSQLETLFKNIENNRNIILFNIFKNFLNKENLLNINLKDIFTEILNNNIFENIDFDINHNKHLNNIYYNFTDDIDEFINIYDKKIILNILFNRIYELLVIYDEIIFVDNEYFSKLVSSAIDVKKEFFNIKSLKTNPKFNQSQNSFIEIFNTNEIIQKNIFENKFKKKINKKSNLNLLDSAFNIDLWLKINTKKFEQKKQIFNLFDIKKLEEIKEHISIDSNEDNKNDLERGLNLLIQEYDRKYSYADSTKYNLIHLPSYWRNGLIKLKELMPNFTNVIDYLYKEFNKIEFKKEFVKLPAILLVGKEGIGKSLFIENLIKILNLKEYIKIFNIGQLQNACDLVGSSRFYSNSKSGYIFKNLIKYQISNPIFILKDLDKVKPTENTHFSNIEDSINKILDKKYMENFYDENVPEISINASNIIWFATAENSTKISNFSDKFKIFDINELSVDDMKQVIPNIYQNFRLKENFNENYFKNNLSQEILNKLSRLTPKYCEKVLNEAFSNAISDNNRTELLEKDFDNDAIKFIINQYSNKNDINLLNSVEFDLYKFADYDNFRKEQFIDEKVKININSKILAHNQYRLRLLHQNWEKILQQFKELYPNFKALADILTTQLNIIQHSKNKIFKLSKPIILLGEGGIGKTAAMKWLADKFNVPYQQIEMNIETGSDFLSGNINEPGKIFSLLAYQAISNPIIVLDELDKSVQINHSFAGLSPLYTLLEDKTAVEFKDNCVKFPINTSYISWIAIANNISNTIPSHLLTRFSICKIEKPTIEENHKILQYMYKEILKEKFIDDNKFVQNLNKDVLKLLENKVPRSNKKILEYAIGYALQNKRFMINPEDIKQVQNIFKEDLNINTIRTVSYGFIPQNDKDK